MAVYFGYMASLLLIVALLVNNDLKFRWYNLFGNISFIVYGMLLIAVPVLITNAILLVINVFYLVKVYSKKENFDLIEFTGDETLVYKFLHFYQKDIQFIFTDFDQSALMGTLNFVVLRDIVIANMFSASLQQNGDAIVLLNYTLIKYRDYKVGKFIFEKEKDFLQSKGVKRIVYKKVDNKKHEQFLKVMGFNWIDENGQLLLIKIL
jgi:hypothetical protein